MNALNESIFREYDIRGIADSELPDPVVEKIAGAAAAVFVRENKHRIAIGMDGRPSSPRIKKRLTKTLARYGLEVIDIGLVPTPVVYFAVFHLDLDGAVVITASHNPGQYNGFKVLVGRQALFGPQIGELYQIAASGRFPAEKKGKIVGRVIMAEYMDYIQKNVHLEKKMRVVVDAGNGTGGLTAPALYRALGADVHELYCRVDGNFPNHHPDPTVAKNLVDLIKEVAHCGADVGIAFDGDADRIGVVDGKGTIIWGDQLLIIFARDVLQRYPGAKIISEVKASEVLFAEIRRSGGLPIMWKTGHSLIKRKIVEEDARLAGEMSGHIFFNDKWFGFDDAVYAGARLLEVLSRRPESLSDILATIPKACNTPEIRVDASDKAKFEIVAAIRDHFRAKYPVNDIDGARISFPHGWALVRASNTQPSLVIRYEADSSEQLLAIQHEVQTALEHVRRRIGA